METFLARHASVVQGTLSGLDRVRLTVSLFRGTQRWLANERGMRSWLWKQQVLLKDFKDYSLGLTEQIKRATELLAEAAHRPVQYLPSSSQRKEEVAREIAKRDGVTQGLVCVLFLTRGEMKHFVGRTRTSVLRNASVLPASSIITRDR